MYKNINTTKEEMTILKETLLQFEMHICVYVHIVCMPVNVSVNVFLKKKQLTAIAKPQLPAHHLGISVVPLVVTHSAPLVVDAYLHPPKVGIPCSHQSDGSVHTGRIVLSYLDKVVVVI